MKSVVHFGLGCVAMAMVLSPSLSATPSPPAEVKVIRAFPDELIVEREVVREVVREHCDTEMALRQLNEVLRSNGITGDATSGNEVEGNADIVQQADAHSGDAILGQVIDIIALCSTVDFYANNQVSDSEAVTGDAEAENDIDLDTDSGERSTDTAIPTIPPYWGK